MKIRGFCVGRWQAAEVSFRLAKTRKASFDAWPEMDRALKSAVERITILHTSSTLSTLDT